MVYQREADDIRELKRERQDLLELEAGLKEEKLKLQNMVSIINTTSIYFILFEVL